MDELNLAQEAIDTARTALGYSQGTNGLIRREEPLQLTLDAIEHVAGVLRELRDGARADAE
ncbi:hypothetical protein [Leifsonia sp. TF02-11]|uniref:hypothetical protein n=1 Tax=Leifsonia sp. TF02-11 TaxID=2815212 RepID=UPI001AA13FAB|nr:hypothetical protein [Leifsonia sp. TF02-11]MBO1739693.1 hypothetical protein [Leifsonia sp. TF02-11]